MSFVSNAERQYLLLLARRLHRYKQEAAARGEEYHDLSGFTLLSCGARAKMEFREKDGVVRPVAIFKRTPALESNFTGPELLDLASEIVGERVDSHNFVADTLEFLRSAS